MTEAETAAISNLVAGAMKELAQDGHGPSEDGHGPSEDIGDQMDHTEPE